MRRKEVSRTPVARTHPLTPTPKRPPPLLQLLVTAVQDELFEHPTQALSQTLNRTEQGCKYAGYGQGGKFYFSAKHYKSPTHLYIT